MAPQPQGVTGHRSRLAGRHLSRSPQAIATQRRTRDAMTGPRARTVGRLGERLCQDLVRSRTQPRMHGRGDAFALKEKNQYDGGRTTSAAGRRTFCNLVFFRKTFTFRFFKKINTFLDLEWAP